MGRKKLGKAARERDEGRRWVRKRMGRKEKRIRGRERKSKRCGGKS